MSKKKNSKKKKAAKVEKIPWSRPLSEHGFNELCGLYDWHDEYRIDRRSMRALVRLGFARYTPKGRPRITKTGEQYIENR